MSFVIVNDPIGGLTTTVRCGSANTAKSIYSTVSGGALNTSSGRYSTISGGYLNTTIKDYSVIGGGLYNTTIDLFNSIGGGSRNTSQKNYSTISGGFSNSTNGCFTTIAGGRNNKSQANYSTIIGGCNNIANGIGSMVFGFDNTANGINTVVLGGSNIVGNNNNTVYVPFLNISYLQTGSSVNNLGIDVSGNIVTGNDQPDVYATGGTFVSNILTIENNNGTSFEVTGFTNGSVSYETVTYEELYEMFILETLIPGSYYLITDFQTCYDQPDFDYNGNSITTPETYHTSDIEPLLVFATSNNTLSPDAYQPLYPNDKIKYDITFIETESTGNPAKGRITERIDEYGNRTDYDHRTVLFKRYKSYFQDGSISGRITEMNNGVVTGLNTDFVSSLTTGSTIWILSNSPQMYEVISIESTTGMTVAGFNYVNFSDPVGFICEIMSPSGLDPKNGTLYYFNDVGTNNISDGGDDMYDGGNGIFTDLYSEIPYTHTQMTDPPVGDTTQALLGDFTYDGTVQSGDTYFNSGSSYFTNLYPGLFVMSAYDVSINDFEIDGNLGSDGEGQADLYNYTLTFSGNDYSVYCKRVWAAQDPSVNHIFIVNTIDGNITHTADLTTEDDLDTISNLSGVTQVHYLLFGLAGGVKATNTQIQNVVNSYLSLINTSDINVTLSNLNSNFTGITSNLPENESGYKSLNFKQNNLTGDTTSFQEYLTFGTLGNGILNNYIGNYANTYLWDGSPFLLSNNVFYGDLDYVNNTFGNSCYNNTFDDDCTNNIIGNFFYNNTTDDDFDENLIGNYFNNNYITSNFQRNRIGDSFNSNTIITVSFYRNDIGNQFNNNVITNGDFQNNEIGNQYNNNIINEEFYKNDIGNGFNGNKTYNNFYGNLIGNGFNNNKVYPQFYENRIAEIFGGNIIGDPTNFGSYNFRGNNIGSYFQSNTITNNFFNNELLSYFENNTFSGEFYSNSIKNHFTNNTTLGVFAFNQIGNSFQNNNVEDGFGYGISQTQGNVIGNNFNNNTIGEYFYNNTIPDNFAYNTTLNYFQWNNFQTYVDYTVLYSCVFYSATTVNVFKNNGGSIKLSYYDSSDVLTVESINEVACVSFTIQSSDFTNGGAIYSNTTALGIDGTEGFENTAPDVNDMAEGYYGEGLQGLSLTQLTNAYNALGLSLTSSTGYIWNVSWGPGSTITNGLVKFGSYISNGSFDIQTVDPTDPNWQTPGNNNGTSLVGTFKFPATFTIYLPLINKGGWC